MLRVVVELWPAWGGCPQVLHEVRISNDGTGEGGTGNYDVAVRSELAVLQRAAPHRREARVEGFPRELGALELARRCLTALLPAPKRSKR